MKHLILLLLPLFVLGACGPKQPPAPKSAQYYLEEGERLFERGRYEEAISAWEKARESYHSPEFNALAELKIAEGHFAAGQYPEAAATYEDFLRQYPKHEKTPETLYRLAMSYYNQMLSIDRDQTATRNALVTFESLIDRFPDHIKSREAHPFLEQLRNRLAAHELYVGNFYLRTGKPESAVRRMEYLLRHFPRFNERDRAYFLLGKGYFRAGNEEKAREAFHTLSREFPQSSYIAPAEKFLGEDF